MPNLNDLQWDYLEGDGDFRSEEVKKLRDEADIIITNPPFSLFREFLAWIVEANKQFIIIGNINCVTYKEVFPLIKDNKVWMGYSIHSGDREFGVPDEYPLEASGTRIDENGKKYIRVKGVRWYTNIDHGHRHSAKNFMTMADNIKFSKHKEVHGRPYLHFDNFDAIEVPYTDAIPCDYEGMMGVPISFLDKYCPEQFEIMGITKTWFGMANKVYPKQIQVSKTGIKTIVTKLNDGPVIELDGPLDGEVYYIVDGKYYTQAYARILIRKK